jgi:hypothetical protein
VKGINCCHHLNELRRSPELCSITIHRKPKLRNYLCSVCTIWGCPSNADNIVVFWAMKPCSLVGRYQRFEGTYCLTLKMEQNDFGKMLVRPLFTIFVVRMACCTCVCSCRLTPRGNVPVNRLVAQLFKIFPEFCGTGGFIIMLKKSPLLDPFLLCI